MRAGAVLGGKTISQLLSNLFPRQKTVHFRPTSIAKPNKGGAAIVARFENRLLNLGNNFRLGVLGLGFVVAFDKHAGNDSQPAVASGFGEFRATAKEDGTLGAWLEARGGHFSSAESKRVRGVTDAGAVGGIRIVSGIEEGLNGHFGVCLLERGDGLRKIL
jgi:hypothetical protein